MELNEAVFENKNEVDNLDLVQCVKLDVNRKRNQHDVQSSSEQHLGKKNRTLKSRMGNIFSTKTRRGKARKSRR